MVVPKVDERLPGSLVLLMAAEHLVGRTTDLELFMQQMMVAGQPMEVAIELLLGHPVLKPQLMAYQITMDPKLPRMAVVVIVEMHGVRRLQPINQIMQTTTGTLANPITTTGERPTMLQPLVVLYQHLHQLQ